MIKIPAFPETIIFSLCANFNDDIFNGFLSFACAKNFHYSHCLLNALIELLNYAPFQYPINYFKYDGHQTGFFGIKFTSLNNFSILCYISLKNLSLPFFQIFLIMKNDQIRILQFGF
jgi:hypothetical protein